MSPNSAPTHVIAHISDTHFLAREALLYGAVDTDATLRQILSQLERSGIRFDALVFTGDIADLGEEDAYRRIRSMVEPVADRLGAQLVWVMGNHDRRDRMRVDLLGETPADERGARRTLDEPLDRVFDLNGLRLIALDSSVPGFHHGELTADQLDWLRHELTTPAPHGTLLALHHPPIPITVPLMPILELQDQHLVAEAIAGTDVRGILGGHLHYATHSLFAGVPISVAAATCYTMDVGAPREVLSGVSGGQSVNLVHVYDTQVVHSVLPIGGFAQVSGFSAEFVAEVQALTPEQQRDAFSRQPT